MTPLFVALAAVLVAGGAAWALVARASRARVRDARAAHPDAVVVGVARSPAFRAAVSPSMREYRRVPASPLMIADASGVTFLRGLRRPSPFRTLPWPAIAGIAVGETRAAYGVRTPTIDLRLADPDAPTIPVTVSLGASFSTPTPSQVEALVDRLRRLAPGDSGPDDPDGSATVGL